MEAEHYTDKSIAVFGETKPWKNDLKELGARFNPNLNGRPGWIISNRHETPLMEFLTQANGGQIEPTPDPPRTDQPKARTSPRAAARVPSRTEIQPSMAPNDALAQLRATAATLGIPAPQPAMGQGSSAGSTASRLVLTGSPGTKVARPAPRKTAGPRPIRAIPSDPTHLNSPTLFVAGDGLTYQIAIYTAPLPSLGQRVTLQIGENSIAYTVTRMEKEFPPFDSILITQVQTDPEQASGVSRASLVAGQWQILGLQDPHTLRFELPTAIGETPVEASEPATL